MRIYSIYLIAILININCKQKIIIEGSGNLAINTNTISIDSIIVYEGRPFLTMFGKEYEYTHLIDSCKRKKVITDSINLNLIYAIFTEDSRFIKYIEGKNVHSKFYNTNEMYVTQIIRFMIRKGKDYKEIFIFCSINEYWYWDYHNVKHSNRILKNFVGIYNKI